MIPTFAVLVFITLVPACWLAFGLIGLFIRTRTPAK
jgi:hypothetical protein